MRIGDIKLRIICLKTSQRGVSTETKKIITETILRRTIGRLLARAKRLKSKSITLSTADIAGGFPLIGSAKIMTQEALRFLRTKTTLKEIIFCIPDKKDFEVFKKTSFSYIEHIQNTLSQGPYITVDAIIELKEGIVFIERSNPPYGLALPGGFVDYGESLEQAVCREAKEETNMTLVKARQFHTYSKPDRDPRFHTIGTVFIAQGKGTPRFGDDAKGLRVVKYEDLLKLDYAFDHKNIIRDYLKARHKKLK